MPFNVIGEGVPATISLHSKSNDKRQFQVSSSKFQVHMRLVTRNELTPKVSPS